VNGRGRLVAVLMLLLTFAVGGLSGMVAEEAFGLDWFDFLDEDAGGEDRLLRGLNLTTEQRASADAVLDRQEDQLEDYWKARLPEIRRILQQSHGEIRALLTPEQQARFDERVRALGDENPMDLGD
jgi:Spy/CpxP family protein refolding chaperone